MKKSKPVTVERIDEILRWIDEGASFDEAIEDENEQEQILRLARDGARSKSDEESNANWSTYERLKLHERRLEKAIDEIIKLVKNHDEELAYDCEKIIDKLSET